MDRTRSRLALRWLRNAFAILTVVLLFAVVALMEPYFSHGLAVGYGPVGAFRWRVVPSVRDSVGFWNHVLALGVTVAVAVFLELVVRSSSRD